MTFPLFADEEVEIIVEFHGTPRVIAALTRNRVQAQSADRATDESFRRLRDDAAKILSAGRSGAESLAGPNVKYEYRNLINGAALMVPRNAIDAIRRLPYVKSLRVSSRIQLFDAPVRTVASLEDETRKTAFLTQMHADKLHAAGIRGAGVVVAIIDTGVTYTLPELGGCLGPQCRVIGGYDFVNDDADPMDSAAQHGTAVAVVLAGNSERYVGVAPEAKILAYRIASDAGILAALERLVDPNGDGDFSDRADVVNLSVGTGDELSPGEPTGNPSDPVSTAADNATRAGVVVLAAAGNSFERHMISNPSQAKTAIAVGLLGGGGNAVSGMTSRGPTPGDLSLKPDLTAPGEGVWSFFDGKLRQFGGTSAACPHAAGAAALLLQMHPNWTPAEVKQALMNTALPLPDDLVLSQGAGVVDAERAANATVAIDPPSLSLGLRPLTNAPWTQTRTLRVTNRGTAAATFNVAATPVGGVTIAASPSTLTIPAGGESNVTLTIEIGSTAVPSPITFEIAGYIQLTSTTGMQSLVVPWAAVKAARLTIVSDEPLSNSMLYLGGEPRRGFVLDAYRSEFLVQPGTYDYFGWGQRAATADRPAAARLVYRHALDIGGEITIRPSTAESHTVVLDGRDEQGRAPRTVSASFYGAAGRLLLGTAADAPYLRLPRVSARTIEVDSLPAGISLLLAESWYDAATRSMYVVQHRELDGLSADTTLTAGGGALRRSDLTIQPVEGGERHLVSLTANSVPVEIAGAEPVPTSEFVEIASFGEKLPAPNAIDFTLWMAPEQQARYRTEVTATAFRDGRATITLPPLKMTARGIATSDSPAQPSERLVAGRGPAFIRHGFSVQTANINASFIDVVGAAGESRQATIATIIRRPDGNVSDSNQGADRTVSGTWTFETVATTTLVPHVPRRTTATFRLDPARGDFVPPIITSLRLVDAQGEMMTSLPRGGSGALLFSAADYTYTFKAVGYQPIRGEATKLFYRYAGAANWTPLPLTQLLEDTGTAVRLADGILYRADLSSISAINDANELVDLRIEIADPAGNTMVQELESAFSVGPTILPRRRAIR